MTSVAMKWQAIVVHSAPGISRPHPAIRTRLHGRGVAAQKVHPPSLPIRSPAVMLAAPAPNPLTHLHATARSE